MSSVSILLNTDQPRKDNTCAIRIRLIVDRKIKYIPTGYHVKPSQFKEGFENWVIKHPDAYLINAAIEKKRSQYAEKIYLSDIEGGEIDISEIGSKRGGKTFLKSLADQQQIYEGRNQVAGFWKVEALIKAFRKAWGKDVPLNQVNKHWAEKFVTERIQAGISPNTLRKELQLAAMVFSEATGEENNAFRQVREKVKTIPSHKEKLSLAEIAILEKAKLSGLEDLARDMFLFSFYTHGMRIESVLLFERSHIKPDHLIYQMEKGKKFREISLHPKLKAIIEKYIGNDTPYLFPAMKQRVTDVWLKKGQVDSAATSTRTRLKRVAIICGINKSLSPHIARHSFADLTKKRNVPIEVIRQALGHSKISTTEIYLDSFKDDVINDAVKGLYD